MKRDFCSEEGVRRILDEFRRLESRVDNRKVPQEQRAVDVTHNVAGALTLKADDDPVWPHEVIDCCTLPQELRVRDDIEVSLRVHGTNALCDFPVGTNGDRRLGDDDRVTLQRPSDLLGSRKNKGQICVAVTPPGRRSNTDEDGVRCSNCGREVLGEGEASCGHIAQQQVMKTRFINRYLALSEPLDLAGILVDADNFVTEVGEAHT